MKASDRALLLALPVLALVAAFWFLVLSPKREEAASLQDEITSLQQEVDEQEQLADYAEQAREDFPSDYQKVVTLGKAVPQDDDTASLFAQLTGVSARADVDFRSLELSEGGEEAPAPPTPAPTEVAPTVEEAEGATVAAVATEAAAATLPIGATIGPAGLPVMPYELQFQGDFFHVADFVHGLDSGVSTSGGQVTVDARLLTIDGFSLTRDVENDYPSLISTFAVTTYVTPETEGLMAGATPSGPVPLSAEAPPATAEPAASTEVTP